MTGTKVNQVVIIGIELSGRGWGYMVPVSGLRIVGLQNLIPKFQKFLGLVIPKLPELETDDGPKRRLDGAAQ